ncbi:manganese efflux pump [Sandaracinobacter neustonicus]|uniref:Putative manganese efflux pump MntP n=1 Tax=Sandaracinobacter neustonicus TaxID=1715348 RepID=A0A501XDH5_9SPHN|nr:manganese efflux pump MntP family protein [Sandaracinobacter neustonicus]TPE58499.1 manganese efflux pump [Sandaracinobacter neustonicus]
MTPIAILILSLSMSTDAFAAAVGRGAAHRPTWPVALKWGLVFGIIEAITPLIGYALGSFAASYVQAIDHWIAFVLLALVGGHMIKESFEAPDAEEADTPKRGGPLGLVLTAIGTSIDAAAVGVGLAFIGVNIWVVAAAIGVSTFVLTTIGMLIGAAVGVRFGKKAELLGGIALISIGLIILGEHMGWLPGL